MHSLKDITYIGTTNFRDWKHRFGILNADRFFHLYVLGKTGAGKSNLILSLCLQDIKKGMGVYVCDVHQDLVHTLVKHIPEYRKKDVLYIDLPNPKLAIGYNPLKKVSYEKRSLVASAILESFQKLWSGSWGDRLENTLRMIILCLLDQPKANLRDIVRILQDDDFRKACIKHTVNKDVRSYLEKQLPKLGMQTLLPVLSKVEAFLAHPVVKRFLIDNPDSLSLYRAMNDRKIVLVNLNKGLLGNDVVHLIGSLLIFGIKHAGMTRVSLPKATRLRQPFHVYLDEFQYYTVDISDMFSELRKFQISLNIAHHYLAEIPEKTRLGILGNVGTIICFRIGALDAEHMIKQQFKEYSPLTIGDYVYLPNKEIIISLMIDGKPSKPFTAKTLYYKAIL